MALGDRLVIRAYLEGHWGFLAGVRSSTQEGALGVSVSLVLWVVRPSTIGARPSAQELVGVFCARLSTRSGRSSAPQPATVADFSGSGAPERARRVLERTRLALAYNWGTWACARACEACARAYDCLFLAVSYYVIQLYKYMEPL